jgi:LDH2 family malate/lactate/ureidoglycolate dehydrogenase
MGTVLPMAGHKGYALALLVEVLSSVLSGSAVGPAIGSMYKQPEKPQDAGHFFFLLDIEGFMDVGLFKHRIDAMVRQIKSCRTKPGVEEIRVPGEHSFRQRQENLAQGIPLDATTVSDLRRLCAELRVDPGESSSLIPGE